MGNLIGSSISSEEMMKVLRFVRQSKEDAKQYEWLYQCTNIASLLNIIKSKEIWLTNLQLVNDKEEAKRITVPEFEKSYYVACFTYADDIPLEHWTEYCNGEPEKGILVGIKNDCVVKKPEFLSQDGYRVFDNKIKICGSFEEATRVVLKSNGQMPYFIIDYGFYKIVYDDELKSTMDGACNWDVDDNMPMGKYIITGFPGTVKNKQGMCCRNGREPYPKKWASEKEIRLKVGVKTTNKQLPKDMFFPRMALPLKENIFDEIILRFSPMMDEKVAEETLRTIKEVLPHSIIHVLDN